MTRKIRKKLFVITICASAVIFASLAYSHCQIPCGIYGDEARFDEIAEHITTITKSMKLITQLSAQGKPNMNQLVRWVQNKEKHADEINHIITYYFMAQRVKLPPEGNKKAYNEYVKKLTLLHEMLVYTMKARQTTDVENVEKLASSLARFKAVYAGRAG